MSLRSVEELKNIRGKRVLVRVDFNVPIERGAVSDDTRIQAALPTIDFLLKRGAKVILMSHFGRPQAKRESRIMNHELRVAIERLGGLLKKKVEMAEKWDFAEIGKLVKGLKAGQVLLLPNLRLHPGEEKNHKSFLEQLAKLGQFYINEAFSVCHRKHASVVGVPKFLPSYAGLQLLQEIEVLNDLLAQPKKPFVAMLGGVKMADKIGTIKTMTKKATVVLVGGALANNFFKAAGYGVGASVVDSKSVQYARGFIRNVKLVLPRDVVVGNRSNPDASARVVTLNLEEKPFRICEAPYAILDIGPRTILAFSHYLKAARTLVWNGPLGFYEKRRYAHGTLALGRLFAARSRGRAFGVAGGGETIDALKQTGMVEYVDFISTGGGAMLEFLSGKKLPGIEALKISPS